MKINLKTLVISLTSLKGKQKNSFLELRQKYTKMLLYRVELYYRMTKNDKG